MSFPVSKLFENIRTGGSGLVQVPTVGKYLAKLDSVKVGESKTSGRKQVSWFFVVDSQAQNHAGQTFGVFHGIADKDGQEDTMGMTNIARYISKLELEPPTSEEQISDEDKFARYLDQATGSTVRLEVKKGKDEDSRYINIEKLISPPETYTSQSQTQTQSPQPSPAKATPKFAVGDNVVMDGVTFKIKTILNDKQCVGENIQNGSISLIELARCSSAPKEVPQTQVQPTTTSEETVELQVGMRIKATNGSVGNILKLDEDSGKIYLQDGSNLFEIGVDEVAEILPAVKQPLEDEVPF